MEHIEDQNPLKNELRRLLEDGEILQDLIGISQARMEQRYGQAYSLFQREEYEESAAIFTHLATLDPRGTRYWMGAATSYIRLGQYDLALTVLTILVLLEPENPQAHYHSGLCLLRQGENREAREAFELARLAAQKDPVYVQIEEEADRLLKEIESNGSNQ